MCVERWDPCGLSWPCWCKRSYQYGTAWVGALYGIRFAKTQSNRNNIVVATVKHMYLFHQPVTELLAEHYLRPVFMEISGEARIYVLHHRILVLTIDPFEALFAFLPGQTRESTKGRTRFPKVVNLTGSESAESLCPRQFLAAVLWLLKHEGLQHSPVDCGVTNKKRRGKLQKQRDHVNRSLLATSVC